MGEREEKKERGGKDGGERGMKGQRREVYVRKVQGDSETTSQKDRATISVPRVHILWSKFI